MAKNPASPRVPKQFAAVSELGAPIRVYLPQRKATTFLGAFFVLAGLALPWYFFPSGFAGRVDPRSVLICLFPFVLGAVALKIAFGNWRKAAVVYQSGLAYSDNAGPRCLRWRDIAEMTTEVTKHYRNFVYVGTTHRYTLTTKGEECVVLTTNDFPDVAELAEQIGHGIFPRLHRAAGKAWNAERWVTFGPVSVHKSDGVRVEGERFAWSKLEALTVENGSLHLVQGDASLWNRVSGKGRIEISAIPNFPVLMAIVAESVSVRAPPSR